MKVELDPQYTTTGTYGKLFLSRAYSVVGGLFAVISITVLSVFGPEAPNFAWVPAMLGVVFLLLGFYCSHSVAMSGAHRMAGLHQQAERLDTLAWLFAAFRPTQEQANRKLSILALRLDLVCKKQAEFYSKNREYLADRAAGSRVLADSSLVREEEGIKCEVQHAKAAFWTLYDALKEVRLIELSNERLGGWNVYLTHCGVGPNDPEVTGVMESVPVPCEPRGE